MNTMQHGISELLSDADDTISLVPENNERIERRNTNENGNVNTNCILLIILFFCIFLLILYIGFYFYRKNQNKEDYYVGGRNIPASHVVYLL